jgi:hypothetical protein
MEHAAAATIETQTESLRCRFCEQPIRPGTGVLAAPRLTPHERLTENPLRLFGTPKRFHALCVPASYRLDERF